jgi:hypothetical protein
MTPTYVVALDLDGEALAWTRDHPRVSAVAGDARRRGDRRSVLEQDPEAAH